MDADRRLCWGFSLFCDDLRAEVGGKVSVMGLYQSDFIFSGSLPYISPKLVILIMYYELADAATQSLEFLVFLPESDPENPIIKMPIDRSKMVVVVAPPTAPALGENPERISHLRIPIVLSPFLVQKEGRIRVRAHYGNGSVLKLGSLHVRAATHEEALSLFGSPPPTSGS
jgi:hypothetical protein